MAFRCEELCDSLWSNVRKIDQHHHRAGQQENEADNVFFEMRNENVSLFIFSTTI